MAKKPTVADLSTEDRVARAKSKTKALVNHAIDLLNLRAANDLIVYSPLLSSQIPTSHAANAFNFFQDGSLKFEIVRLCALLDHCRLDDFAKESIPAVIAMIDCPKVLETLEDERRLENRFQGVRSYDETESPAMRAAVESASRANQEEFANKQASKARFQLEFAIRSSRHIQSSSMLKSVRNFRDKYLAHSLEQTNWERRESVGSMKYGYERRLLSRAIALVNALYLGVNGVSYGWAQSVRIARDNAEALWKGCTFKVLR